MMSNWIQAFWIDFTLVVESSYCILMVQNIITFNSHTLTLQMLSAFQQLQNIIYSKMELELSVSDTGSNTIKQAQKNHLLEYLSSCKKQGLNYDSTNIFKKFQIMSLEEMKCQASQNYKMFQSQRWTRKRKSILIYIVVMHLQQKKMPIQHRIELQIWDSISRILNAKRDLIIMKWISILKSANSPEWTEQEDDIVRKFGYQSQWLDGTLSIYLNSGRFILRNHKCAQERWKKIYKNLKPCKKQWTDIEDALIFLLFQANNYPYSEAQSIFRDRYQKHLNNRHKSLMNKVRKHGLSKEIMDILILMMIRLSQRAKLCPQVSLQQETGQQVKNPHFIGLNQSISLPSASSIQSLDQPFIGNTQSISFSTSHTLQSFNSPFGNPNESIFLEEKRFFES